MTWFVPGRIEVLGKHTDYAGGRSLLAAAEQGVTASASVYGGAAEPAGLFLCRSTAMDGEVLVVAGENSELPPGHWGNYVQATVDRLSMNFGDLQSAIVEVDSTLPLASGMSSSSALVCAVALAIADLNDLWSNPKWQEAIQDRVDLAAYLATIENGLSFKNLPGTKGVGTFGGSQDHTAMLNCDAGKLGVFRFAPTVAEGEVDLPDGWTFVVAVSGVLAEKTGAALEDYNNASLQVSRLVEMWNQREDDQCATLAQVLAVEGAQEKLSEWFAEDPRLEARLRAYVVEMQQAIPAALEALSEGDVEAFGRAVEVSHRNADESLGNQIVQTNALQRLAKELGAAAASGFGAGFGGSVWALAPVEGAQEFADAWLAAYLEEYPDVADTASTLVTTAAPSAHRV